MTETGTDELYALDPGEFVAARNELARQLRRAGDREQAAEVAKLRRPSPAAWAVNQLVRRHRADVEELVRLGEVLRGAQDRALGGDAPGDLRAAGRARRDAVARLAATAERILAERGASPGAHAAEVGATLEAASLDAAAAAAVLGGRLSADLQPPSGFGPVDGAVAPRAAPAPRPEPGADRRELDEAEAAAAEARGRWEERSAQAREAVARVAERRREVRAAEAEVDRLADLLDQAQRAVRRAVREAERAEDAAARAEDVAARAAERVRAADQRVADLRG